MVFIFILNKYSFFNTSCQIQKFRKDRSDNFFFDYDTDELWTYVDKIMDKKMFYADPYYLLKNRNIFGYGGFCHYRALFNDIKHNLDNNVDIMCFRVKRNRNMYILVIYWILVQGMFITSFLISLFIKYGLIIIYEKFYLKYFKKENKDDTDNDDAELIPLSRIETTE